MSSILSEENFSKHIDLSFSFDFHSPLFDYDYYLSS